MKIEHSTKNIPAIQEVPKKPFLTIHIEQQENGTFAITPVGNLGSAEAVHCLELFLKQIKDSAKPPKLIL